MEYIVFGTTYGFASTETTDEEHRFIEQFYRDDFGTKTYVHKRYNNKVYYTRAIYGDKEHQFCDYKGRPGGFLGILIGFEGKYCHDFEKVERILDDVYQNFVDAGFIKETNGGRKFMIEDFEGHKQGIHQAVEKAVRCNNLTSNDLQDFKFNGIKGTYHCHPSDMPLYNKAFMDLPYNLEISDKNPTQAMLRASKVKMK